MRRLECVDDLDWVDSYGDGCDWYVSSDECQDAEEYVDWNGESAKDKCCMCGGGSEPPRFVRGQRGSNECPAGYARITDYDACAEASAALSDPQPHDRASFYHQTQEDFNDSRYP